MELEPITRQEQIIAGKDLEPITRMEKFLKKYGGSGGSGGVSPEEVTTIVKEQFPGGVGYSEVTEVGGDTVTWDGSLDGKVVLEVEVAEDFVVKIFKLSDAVPTHADCANGGAVNVGNGRQTFDASMVYVFDSGMVNIAGQFFSVPSEAVGKPVEGYNGMAFPEPGLYGSDAGGMLTSSMLQINGYNGFKTVAKVTKPISAEYLPNVADIPETWIADLKAALGI